MKLLFGAAVIAGSLALAPAFTPAMAQSAATFGLAQVQAACLSSAPGAAAACQAAVAQFIATVKASGLTAAQQDNVLAELVLTLGSGASTLSPEIRLVVADAINTVAGSISDAALAAQIQVAASDVSTGVDVGADDLDVSPA